MRFLTALFISGALLASVAVCQWLVGRNISFSLAREVHGHGEHENHTDGSGEHMYQLILTPGFAAVKDPFAIALDNEQAQARLLVRHEDRVLLSHSEDLQRGQSLTVEAVAFSGETAAIFIQATPGDEESMLSVPLRVQILKDDILCDDHTLWSEGQGQPIAAELMLSLTPKRMTLDRGLGRNR